MTGYQQDSSIVSRMIRAARLEPSLYEEVEHDRDATRQAAFVVVGTSLATGIGGGIAVGQPVGLVLFTGFSLVGWALFAWLTYFIGTRWLAGPETEADWGELARALGFARAPYVLLIFGVVPALAGLLGLVVSIWVLVASVIAIRQALDFSTGRAIATIIIGAIAQGILMQVPLVLLA
jgi:hypothetical protein